MSIISIKTVKSKTFFSGSINLSGQKEVSLDSESLTKTQALDILEAYSNRHLIVSDIEAVKTKFESFSNSGSSVEVTSELGDSESLAVSQKLFTTVVGDLENFLIDINRGGTPL